MTVLPFGTDALDSLNLNSDGFPASTRTLTIDALRLSPASAGSATSTAAVAAASATTATRVMCMRLPSSEVRSTKYLRLGTAKRAHPAVPQAASPPLTLCSWYEQAPSLPAAPDAFDEEGRHATSWQTGSSAVALAHPGGSHDRGRDGARGRRRRHGGDGGGAPRGRPAAGPPQRGGRGGAGPGT